MRSIIVGMSLLVCAVGCEVVGAGGDAGADSDASGGAGGGAGAGGNTGGSSNGGATADATSASLDAVLGGDASVSADAGSVPIPTTYDEIPAAAVLRLAEVERRVLPGQSTDPTDGQPGPNGESADRELAAADMLGDLAIAAEWDNDAMWYFIDGRYNDGDFSVARATVGGLPGAELPAYSIDPPNLDATDFLGTRHVLLYRFPEAADWRVYEFIDGALRGVAEVPAASVVAGGFTRLPGLYANADHARTFVFAPADRRISTFTELGGGADGARLADAPVGRIVQVQIPVSGAPHDTVEDERGPSSWANIYGVNRIFHPVRRDTRPGVVWQDQRTHEVFVTWLSDTRPGDFETSSLPNIADGRLGGAFSEPDGTITLLLVEGGDGRNTNTARAVVVLKAGPNGQETRRNSLDAGPDALNVVDFEGDDRQNHSVMQRSGNRIGVLLARTIHRTPDGLNHQSGGAFLLDAETLQRVTDVSQTSGHSWGSVLQAASPGQFLAMDLGDNYPRGVHLHRLTDDGLQSRVVFTLKTLHGEQAVTPAGETYPIYPEASGDGHTYYQWSNDNRTYTELGGMAETPQGIVSVFATERSLLDNSRVGADWNETRELAMVRVRSDFEQAAPGRGPHWVTDDLVRSAGEPAAEGRFYSFNGGDSPQRVAGVVFLTALGADESATRPKLHRTADGLLALYEVWRTVRAGEGFADTYLDTRAMRLGDDGLPVAGQAASLGRGVRLSNRDDAFALAGGTAVVEGRGDGRLVVTLVLPAAR